MYNEGHVALGQDGFFSNFENAVKSGGIFTDLSKGLQTGLSVYDKVQNLENLIRRRKQARQQPQYQPTDQGSYQQEQPAPSSGPNWNMIALIGGGGAILVLIILKMKK